MDINVKKENIKEPCVVKVSVTQKFCVFIIEKLEKIRNLQKGVGQRMIKVNNVQLLILASFLLVQKSDTEIQETKKEKGEMCEEENSNVWVDI